MGAVSFSGALNIFHYTRIYESFEIHNITFVLILGWKLLIKRTRRVVANGDGFGRMSGMGSQEQHRG